MRRGDFPYEESALANDVLVRQLLFFLFFIAISHYVNAAFQIDEPTILRFLPQEPTQATKFFYSPS